MKGKIGIIIQGPTTHVDKMISTYFGYKHVLWSTWKSEPKENLNKIRQSKIKLLTNNLPKHAGVGHVNYQCLSTYNGIKELAKNKNIQIFVKCRQDLVVDNLQQFTRNIECSLAKHQISFLSAHKLKGGYLQDYIVAGGKEQMLKYWKPELNRDSGLPSPERWLQARYFKKSANQKWNEFHKNLAFISLENIKIYSLKWNFCINEYPKFLYTVNNPKRKKGVIVEIYFLTRWMLKKYLFKEVPIQTSKQIRQNRKSGIYNK